MARAPLDLPLRFSWRGRLQSSTAVYASLERNPTMTSETREAPHCGYLSHVGLAMAG